MGFTISGRAVVVSLCFALAACSSSTGSTGSGPATLTDDQYKQQIVTGMHDSLQTDLDSLLQAAKDMQTAAPTTPGRGWDKAQDGAAIEATKEAWIRARTAYEHIEGALAPIFPDIDTSIDARYDDFLGTPGGADSYLFDDQGVTGLHAIERILYVDVTPQHVIDFEKTLPGYVAAAFPATEQESSDFKNKLCGKVITDAQTLHDQWQPAKIDIALAFQGLISLMNEQKEKVNKASSNEEESRYSQRTMADIRDNLDGTQKIYTLFQTWLVTKPNATDPTKDGKQADGAIISGMGKLNTLYSAVTGDAIPQPPATWSAENPSAADLATPFGQLYSGVLAAVNPDVNGSVVDEMNTAATILGFPQFKEGQ